MTLEYEINLRPLTEEQGGGWAAFVPALPGCLGDGETPSEALADAHSAIQAWIDTAKELGTHIPKPVHEHSGKFTLRLPKSLHAELENKAEADGVSLNQECVSLLAYALGKNQPLQQVINRDAESI